MNEITSCPNCGTKIKDSIFSGNSMMSNAESELIAEMNGTELNPGCKKCQGEAFKEAHKKFKSLKAQLQTEIKKDIHNVPIITVHTPFNWDYKILGIATGQSTTGTGMFSETASAWTDFFGLQSNAYNKKISGGEALCGQQVRSKAIQMGGNAIIGVDIDYSELGGGKGMIMVCMSGTVIRLNNMEVLDQYKVDSITRISKHADQLRIWSNKYAELIEK
jgi:uncharacterized protein YbjQ (UPF0145 family)